MNSCLYFYGHGFQKFYYEKFILRTYLWMWAEIQLKPFFLITKDLLSVFLNNKKYLKIYLNIH